MALNKLKTLAGATAFAAAAAFSPAYAQGAANQNNAQPVVMTPDAQEVERVSAKEAFQRSAGQIVFMDAGNLPAAHIYAIEYNIKEITKTSEIPFEVIAVNPKDTQGQSMLCYNAKGCYPVTIDNLVTNLSTVEKFGTKHGLKFNKDIASLELTN